MAWLLLVALVTAVILGWTLAATNWGAQRLAQRLLPSVPGHLSLGSLEGSLAHGLALGEVRYLSEGTTGEARGIELEVRRLELASSWSTLRRLLFEQRLELGTLHATEVRLTLPQGAEKTADDVTSARPPPIVLPVALSLETLSIDRLTIESSEKMPATEGETADPLELHDIELRQLRAGPADQPVRFAALAATSAFGEIETIRARLEDAEVRTQGAYPFRVATALDLTLALPGGEQPQARPPKQLRLRVEGRVEGDLERLELSQVLHTATSGRESSDPPAQTTVSLEGSLLTPLEEPVLALRTEWQAVRWPPVPGDESTEGTAPVLLSKEGSATLDGTLDQLRFQGSASLEGPRIPPGEWSARGGLTLDANHQLDSITLEHLAGALLGGGVNASGTLRLDPSKAAPPSWRVALSATRLDPGKKWPQWTGSLSGSLSASGTSLGASLGSEAVIQATIERLDGTLRGYPVRARGTFASRGPQIQTLDLHARSGNATLALDGKATPNLDLRFLLEIPDLEQVLPESGGRIAAQGTLRGARERPRLAFDFEAHSLTFQDAQLADARGSAEVLAAEDGALRAHLTASDLRYALAAVDSLELSADGTLKEHFVELSAHLPERSLIADAAGALTLPVAGASPSWSGTLRRVDLRLPETGSWQLAEPSPLLLSRSTVELPSSCWRPAGAAPASDQLKSSTGLCLDLEWREDAPWQTTVDATALPLELLSPLLDGLRTAGGASQNLEISGTLAGRAELHGQGIDLERAELTVRHAETTLRRLRLADRDEQLSFRIDNLSLSADDRGLRGRALLGSDELEGELQGELELPGYELRSGVPTGDETLRAHLEGQVEQLERFSVLLPWVEAPSGRVLAELDLDGTLAKPSVSGRVRLLDGAFQLRTASADPRQPVTLDVTQTDATLAADAHGAHVELSARTTEPAGQLTGRLDLPAYRVAFEPLPADQRLDGGFRFELDDVASFAPLLSDLEDLEGSATASFSIGGTLGEPAIDGEARLADLSANLPTLGLELRDGSLTLRGRAGDRLEISGSVRSGSGQLDANGSLRVARGAATGTSGAWTADLHLTGNGVEIANTPQLRLRANSDVTLQIEPRKIRIDGDVDVPWGRADLEELDETAVEPSSDVVFVGGEPASAQLGARLEPPPPPMELQGRLRVRFGDDVQFRGLGLDTKLGGSILVTEPVRGETLATGHVLFEGGSYTTYGQRLQIESGNLIFGGGPIVDPGLDVTAYRTVGTVKAGVAVSGTLERPIVDLVSQPSMSESDILHYMILGRAPGTQTSAGEGQLLTQAAASLGLRSGNRLARQLAARYGLDELRLESNGSYREASLVIGKYLSPDIYVSYGVGLFEPISTFTLRYVLSTKWTLSAEKGRTTSADVFYEIETGSKKRKTKQEPQPEPPPER